jgi:hypothetical protein
MSQGTIAKVVSAGQVNRTGGFACDTHPYALINPFQNFGCSVTSTGSLPSRKSKSHPLGACVT